MENSTMTTSQLIADSYVSYHNQVYLYILHKVNCREEAEDLSQDVFLRLMEYKQMLRPDTVKFFIYTISRNLVNDYFLGDPEEIKKLMEAVANQGKKK